MKKLFISLCLLSVMAVPANAKATAEQVRTFFNSYVTAANNFDANVFDKYFLTVSSKLLNDVSIILNNFILLLIIVFIDIDILLKRQTYHPLLI